MLFHFPQPGQLFMRFAFGAGMGMARHQAVLVMHNMPLPVMFHMDVRILFRVQPDFFPTHRVFHGKLVETPSAVVAGCGHAFEHRAAFIFRQFIRRHGTRVVQAAGDNRTIRVPFQKGNYDLMPDTGQSQCAEPGPGPAMRHAKPAACMFVPCAFTIPEELHLDPPVLIRVNLFAFRARDKGVLLAHDPVFGMGCFGHETGCLRNGRHPGHITHAPIRGLTAQNLRLLAMMRDADDPPSRVHVLPLMTVQRKHKARHKTGNIRFRLKQPLHRKLPQKLQLRVTLPFGHGLMKMRVAVDVIAHARSHGSLLKIRLCCGSFEKR